MENNTDSVTQAYPTINQSWGIVGILVALMLAFTPVTFVLTPLVGKDFSMLIYYLLSVGISFWIVYRKRVRKTRNSTFVLEICDLRITLSITLVTLALLFGIISPLQTLIPMPQFFQDALKNLMSNDSILGFGMIVIAAPILEEFIFRGIMLDGLLKQYSPVTSILVSSALFGLVHLNPWQFITGFIIGIFSGWVYYRSKSLMPSIIIHVCANLTAFVAARFSQGEFKFDETLATMYGGITNLLVVIGGCGLLIYSLVSFMDDEFERVSG